MLNSLLSFLKKRVLFLFPVVGLVLSLGFNFYFWQRWEEQSRVVDVVDGDTFQMKGGKRVRLMGVDAPEYDRCGGAQARQTLSRLVLGKRVTLKEEVQETFGRSLALVYMGKTLVNRSVLIEGWGRTDYRRNSQRAVLTAAYHEAKDNQRGIFSDLCRKKGAPEGDCLIKGNIDSSTYEKFYHLPSCRHYEQIVINKDIGDGYFCSEAEASAAGFRKAGGCP